MKFLSRLIFSMAFVSTSFVFMRTNLSANAESVDIAEEHAFQTAAAKIAHAVVRIEPVGFSSETNDDSLSRGPSTGIVVDQEGWVLTTSFAVPVDKKESMVVIADAKGATLIRRVARVVGRDVSRGLVLLKMENSFPLKPIDQTVSKNSLNVGQWTICVARGWDARTPNIAVGILSAVNRAWGRALQTDAAVSPVNYGGALVDIHGDFIGMLAPMPAETAGMMQGTELYDSGIGFAVPVEDIQRVLPRLKAGETIAAGMLGISYRSRDVFTGPPIIATSRPGSPAAKVGLQSGDRIVDVGGRSVSRIADVRHAMSSFYAGDQMAMVVERENPSQKDDVQRITVMPRLVATLPPWRRSMIGIVPKRSRLKSNRETQRGAVEVDWVWPNSPASESGIVEGVTIQSIKYSAKNVEPMPVSSVSMLAGVLSGIEVGESVTLIVRDSDGGEQSHKMTTVVMPDGVPEDVPARLDLPSPPAVVKLEAAEISAPPIAVIPVGKKEDVVGVLIYFGRPHGPVDVEEAAIWQAAANRYGVAIIFPGSADPQRWGRVDIQNVARSIESLRSRRDIDELRLAVAGTGAGGAFSWLVAEALGPAIRGVVLHEAALPRQSEIRNAEPGRFRWILFAPSRTDGKLPSRIVSDCDRLKKAGYDVGVLPEGTETSIPTEILCSFVEALGVL